MIGIIDNISMSVEYLFGLAEPVGVIIVLPSNYLSYGEFQLGRPLIILGGNIGEGLLASLPGERELTLWEGEFRAVGGGLETSPPAVGAP